jgi:hypothetical protein
MLAANGLSITLSNATPNSLYRVYLPVNISSTEAHALMSPYTIAFSFEYTACLEETCQVLFTIYFDKNGGGVFSYDTGYVASFDPLYAPVKLSDGHYLYFQSADNMTYPPVQIACSLQATSNLNSSKITIENVELFTLGT